MPIRMKVYHRGPETLVAACDEELLGKTFRERGLRIEVSSFYEGDRVTEDQLLAHVNLATMGNFVGRETVDAVTRGGFVAQESVLWIDGVPHAQFVVM
ncbi:MAG: DUF424 family protein [Methanobacteriota archaeon]|nr:MAG: DUF424 family protein [Euryarchaeota archaeon]